MYTLNKDLEEIRFEKCDFGPGNDECDDCDRDQVQLYYGGGTYYHPNDGSYLCASCVTDKAKLYRDDLYWGT